MVLTKALQKKELNKIDAMILVDSTVSNLRGIIKIKSDSTNKFSVMYMRVFSLQRFRYN